MKNLQFNLKSGFFEKLKLLLVLVGVLIGSVTTQMWAKTKNVAWKGNIFFRAPDNWDLSTNSTIQVGVARTTNVDNKTYIAFLATMDRVGTTRLYYKWVDKSHGNWWQDEYVFFTANSSSQSDGGDRKVNAYACYTTPIEGEFEDSEYPFLFNPTSESNGASVTKTRYTTGSKYGDRIPSCLNFAQTVNLYTNGSASNTGGSVNISGTALTGNTSTTSVNTTSSSNSVSDNTVVGSSVTLTATPASGYNFDGWYTVSSGGEAVSTSTTYPAYTCTGAKTLYARFVTASTKKLTVSAGTGISGTSGTTDNITAGQNISIGATVATGYTWNTWTLSGDGTLSTFTAGTKDQTVTVGTAANMTLTASATENMSALSTSCSYNTGTPGYDAPAVTDSYTTVGYVTTREITAATPGDTYYLSGWTITNGARTDGGGDTANPITVRSNGNGSAVSVVANYSTKTKVRLYYSNPDGWTTVKAYVWYSSNSKDKNAEWSGVDITSNTIERNGTTYWYYEYYKEGHSNWDRVIFNDGSNQTNNITFDNTDNNGQYHSAGDRNGSHSSGSWNALPAAETTYSITFNAGAHGSITAYGEEITAGNSANVEIGSTARSLTATNATGYHFNGWTKSNNNVTIADASSASTTISASGTSTVTATWAANTYTITLNDNGGSGGDGTHSVTYNSATSSLTNAPERDHYTFDGYYASSGGTGTKVFNANLTPVQNAATYTDNTSDKKWIYAGDKELYAKWTEIPYTVTLQNATESSVSAGCETGTNITAVTAGLPFGMGFDHWEVVSGNATFVNANAVTTKVKATSDCTVKAVYTQKLYAYIEGRFHVASASNHSSWTNTFDDGDWNQNSTKIQFAYDESSHIFYLHTYATANALTTQISDQDPVFFIKTSTSSSSLTGVTEYKMSTATEITDKGSSEGATFDSNATGDTNNGNLRINSSDVSALVTLYFDGTKVWYDYSPAIINNIGLSDNVVPPGASITATPNMYVKGAVNKAYCWGVYTDAACTEGNKVDVSFNSIGGGKVDFTVPLTTGTYYLKLKVHASAACDVAVDDSKVVSFEVTTTKMIYFKNVPNWSNVYVYFYYGEGASGYWTDTKGTGPVKGGKDRVCSASTMKRIGKTDIYYYQYGNWSGHVVAFADHEENDNEFFDQCQVAYREDFSTCAQMYVPENYIHDYLNYHDNDRYRTCYYSSNNANKIRGYWTTYPRTNAGFAIKLYGSADGSQEGDDITFTKTGANTYVAEVNLDPATHATYYYNLYACAGDNGVSNTKYTLYGNSGNMSISDSENWNFYTQIARCRITPAAAGTYKFKLLLSDDGAVQVSVEYPLAVGDYRLLYTDGTHTKPHPTRFIRGRANGKDTISVWINPDDAYHVLKVQQCTAVSPKIIWSNYNWSGSDATGAINITSYSKGVYNFYLTQNESKALTVQTSKTVPYTGLYYIRCSSVGGGWLGYKTNDDNLMTYTKYAEDKNYGFNYYKAKWVNDVGSDVTYTIACDYSESLCDTLVADAGDDPLNASQAVSIPHNANIRFGWSSLDNTLQRAYINGSTNASDRYLVLKGEHEKIVDENGNAFSVAGLEADETTFVDLNNWIYRVDLKAKPNGGVKVIANYNGEEQFFIGDAGNYEEIIGSSEDQWWPLRVTYDFKTNRLMTAWLPSGSQVTSNIALNADMMLIREGQNAATQVFFNGSGKAISDIHTIYGVMEFQYDNIVGKFPSWSSPNAYKYLMYYISFPFDVKVSEIFGCGVRGENWIVQKYNGAKRARIGWFAETSTFWETMEGSETMNAYEGYLLLLDRISFNDSGSSLWFKQGKGNSIYLYFPSTSVASGTISEDETTIHVPEHTCTIDRTFDVGGVGTVSHKNTDSHWNVIGTPLFEDKEATTIATPSADGAGATTLQYYYAWNSADNTLAAQAAFDDDVEFKSMHSYMVQYAGDVTFSGAKLTPPPASVAARRIPGDKKNYRIKLRMMNEDGNRSETFVELRENACDTFALNEDMYMMRSSTMVDLYTFAGAYDVAANVLSMNNHIVPVGMDVKRAGTYRFTMPSDFSGTVTLIDTEADVRTNLALGDYEVNLPKGTSNNRFLLEINIQQMPTAIDGVGGSLKDGKAHKFIENGQMYILRNGVIYDARGCRVR